MQETITIGNLATGYKGKHKTHVVAHDINASIYAGELTCLLGANGAGKSTLLHTLSGFLPKLSGEIRIMGKEVERYSDADMSKVISVVLTEKCDLRNMTAEEMVALGRSPYTGFWGVLKKGDKEIVSRAIAGVGIEALTSRMMHTLSDGEKQKVMIAKALAQETPVIFLDEPTAFLDFPSKVEMMQLLHRLSRETGKTIFMSTHDLELALQIADKVYMEPLTLEYVAKIVRYERPDAIVPGLGGQTGLNLAVQLAKKGVLQECQVEILGTSFQSIEQAEDRELFKELCQSLGEPVLPSLIANNIDEAVEAAKRIGYPVVLRPAFTLGGTGGGFADDETQLREMMRNALSLSPVHQVLIEKSIKGYKEIEYEVIRDHNDTAIAICNMENIDPVGVHTGDSIVVAPSQTLTNKEYQLLRDSALRLIRALKIEGGCNVQFALDPLSFNYYLIEVNPRVSRSSALASKASGYPIARVSAKIAVGLTLDEIRIANTPASFEPALDYVVTKIARFPFDKFSDASNQLGTQMKATGEVMSVGRTMEESLLKAVRSLETGVCHIYHKKFDDWTVDRMLSYIKEGTDDRLYAIAELIRRGVELALIYNSTKIDMFFLEKFKNIVEFEKVVAANPRDIETLRDAKRMGFSDKFIGQLWGMSQKEMFLLRREHNIFPVYKMIDTCASEFSSYVPYFYSTYEQENESIVSEREKIVVLGSGPIRIGQGVEFDYSTVHAIWSIRAAGYEAIIINNNPETVSTDYTTSDKLYFEPLTVEDVMNVITLEKPKGIVVSLGGQTAINLAEPLHELGVPIIGTGVEAIRNAEDRGCFEKIMEELGIPQPEAEAVTDIEAGVRAAERIGYPVLVRPSYVLGGRAMQIVSNEERLRHYLQTAVEVNEDSPVLVDRYIMGRELEVDAICDGKDVFIPGIMEHVEKTGIHSGDSISVYPTFSVSQKAKDKIIDYTVRLGRRIGIVGLYNIQFILDGEEDVYVIEVNPRSSRTVPFLSKATGVPMADIATRVILGHSLREQGITEVYGRERSRWFVKAPAFSFAKIRGMESYLSPEMKSTGEAIGYDNKLTRALYKALQSSGMTVANYGTIFLTIADKDKQDALPLVRRFYDLGFNIEATKGTAEFLRQHGIRTRTRRKLSEGSTEIIDSLRQGHVSYVINTIDINQHNTRLDGYEIRRTAVENNVTIFTALETVKVLLDVLEEITLGVSTIDAE